MKRKIILDSGPLVAFLNKNDLHHDWAKRQFSMLMPPLITCESVLSEVCFLLGPFPKGARHALELMQRDLIVLSFDLQTESMSIKSLLERYEAMPMSLADACLVRLAEQISESVILTTNRNFTVYRKNKRDIIPVILPDDP
ncbi:PIN domain-containing protein [candidate division KSB1 bacterium]|nr:PIN domain-containing protein [candidate division KSB1 bacterium]RQW06045.1 MAG: type II toxin-antitoxin system VapC family toxin [candidate division KSB1 bacterium]